MVVAQFSNNRALRSNIRPKCATRAVVIVKSHCIGLVPDQNLRLSVVIKHSDEILAGKYYPGRNGAVCLAALKIRRENIARIAGTFV